MAGRKTDVPERLSGGPAALAAALEALPFGISLWDAQERLVLFNRRYGEIYDLPLDRLERGMPLAEACKITVAAGNHPGRPPEELLALYRERLAESAAKPEGIAYEKQIRGRMIRSVYLPAPGVGTLIVHEDVTEQRAIEDERPGIRLREVLESIGTGIALWDEDLHLVAWNRDYQRTHLNQGFVPKAGMTLAENLDNAVPLLNDARTGKEIEGFARNLLKQKRNLEVDRVLADGRIVSVAYHPFSGGGWIAIYQDVTDRRRDVMRLKASERELTLQNARLDASLDSMPYGFVIWDADLRLNLWNERFVEIYAFPPDAIRKGATLMEIFLSANEAGHFQGRSAREMTDSYRSRLIALKEGESLVTEEVLVSGRVIKISHRRAPDGTFVATHEDITEQRDRINALKHRETDLQLQNMRFAAAVDNMSQGLCMFDREQRLVICNKRYADMYGLPPELVQPGTSLEQILKSRIDRGLFPVSGSASYVQRRRDLVTDRKDAVDEVEMRDGRVISILHHPMSDGGWVSTHQDITEQRRNEARIRHLARHDALTELPNRMHFRDRMESAEARIGRGDTMAVLFIDLDHFKAVNDLLGHATGDAVLRMVAARLRASVREDDVVARLGGDEFAVLHGPLAQPQDAAVLADRIVKGMAQPFEIEGHNVLIGGSVGIAVAPIDGVDAGTLMKNADLALYRAKSDGRGTYHFFEPGMDAAVQERLALEIELRQALARSEFTLAFQPLFSLEENRIRGFEALLRWNHPDRGLVMPDVIIPIAEESGLIVPIGEWVLKAACAAAAHWPEHIRIAVNLSPVQFKHRSLVDVVIDALAASGLPANRLDLEVTESVLLADNEMTLRTLHQLRALGVRISMDDFGTGYSSLSYLRSFPFDKIKIDRSFVSDIASRDDSVAIINAVIGLGKSLGMSTTAEGIETEDQLEMVRKQGCTEVQGFLFSPPLPASAVDELFRKEGAGAAPNRAAS